MADKRERQATIVELVRSHDIGSQEDLRRLLRQRGWSVTQATLSRDLHELGVARMPAPAGGVRYAVVEGPGAAAEEGKAALDALLPQLFRRVDGVGEMVVLHTVPGGAQPIGAAIDAEGWVEVLGTLAGDDTILIICRSAAARERLVRRLRALGGGGAGA